MISKIMDFLHEVKMRMRSSYKHMKFGWGEPWNEFDQDSSILRYNQMLIKEWLEEAPKHIIVTKRRKREVRELLEVMRRMENDWYGVDLITDGEDINIEWVPFHDDDEADSDDLVEAKFTYIGVNKEELNRRNKLMRRNSTATLKRFGELMERNLLRFWW